MGGLKSSSEMPQIDAAGSDPLEIGPYRLDPGSRVLSRGADAVPLSPKLFQLLLVLAESRGRVVTREEVTRRVWPAGLGSPGNLHQSVSALRKALGPAPGGGEWIENVKRRGYR